MFFFCYINITVTILYIICLPAFYLKHYVSETEFCLRLQVGARDRTSIWTNLSRYHLKTETEFSLHPDDGYCPQLR
jgi:hypothetical protein